MTALAQILDRVDLVLKAALAGQGTVWRERSDAYCIEEAPGVNALPRDIATTPQSAEFDVDELQLDLRFFSRGEPPSPQVEVLHQLAHNALFADAQLLGLVDSIRRVETSFDHQAADTTSLIKSVRYRLLYLTPTKSL